MLEIKTDGIITRFYQNGQEIKDVRKAELRWEAGCLAVVNLEIYAHHATAQMDNAILDIKEEK